MSRYGDGYRLECDARADLRAAGYEVFRSAGSKGAADLILFKPGEVLFVQAKKADGRIGPADRAALLGLAAMVPGGRAVSARYHKDGRAARTIRYDLLTGPGPKDRQPWTPDYALEES